MASRSVLAFLLLVLMASQVESSGQLIDQLLFSRYHKYELPPQRPVNVSVGLTLQTTDLDVEKGILTSILWFSIAWNDPRLRWDLNEFNDSVIRVSSEQLWLPDLEIYNVVGIKKTLITGHPLILVTNDGSISFIPPYEIQTTCKVDLTYYPYDEQVCEIKLGSWTHHGQLINPILQSDMVDISTFRPLKWGITNSTAVRNVLQYECCPEAYIDITYTFHLKRMQHASMYCFQIPLLVLGALIPFLFFVSGSGRLILGCSILLGSVLGITMVSADLPKNPTHPALIVQSYAGLMIVCGVALILSMLMATLWQSKGRTRPPWSAVKSVVVDGLGKLVCVRENDYSRKQEAGEGLVMEVATVPDLQWRMVAIVLDRLFFVLFTVVLVVYAIVNAN